MDARDRLRIPTAVAGTTFVDRRPFYGFTTLPPLEKRLRPERGAKSPRESAWGWGGAPRALRRACGPSAARSRRASARGGGAPRALRRALRPERGAKPPRERAWGWGPTRIEKGLRHGSTNFLDHRSGGTSVRPGDEACEPVTAAAPQGVAVDAVGRPQPQLPDRGQRPERHLAGERPAGGLEAAARRGLFVAGRRGRRALHDVRQARRRSRARRQRRDRRRPSGNRPTPMTFQSDAAPDMGNGPYSTPLIVGNRLFTTGVAGRLQCLDKKTGKVLWTQQLWADHRGSRLMYGYASSPIAFRETVIVPVGGPGQVGDGVPAGRRQGRLGQERFRQRLLVADPDQRRRPRTAGRADGRRDAGGQSAQRRPAVAGAVQGRLFDRRRDAGLGPRQPAVRLVGVQRRHEGDRAASATESRRRRPRCGATFGCGSITATRCASATRSTSRAAARAARRS